MLHVDIPSLADLRALAEHRGDICVSIYLPTSALTQKTPADRIELKNLTNEAFRQLAAVSADKRRVAALVEQLDDLGADDEFWRHQARSLAVFATPDNVRTFRVPNAFEPIVEVSDRFHLKPLIRTLTFPNSCFVLALAEGGVRLVEVFADLPAVSVRVEDMPKDADNAVGRANVNARAEGTEGQKKLLTQFARKVDAALRPVLTGKDRPLILAAAQPLASIYRSVNTYAHLAATGIDGSPASLSDGELAERARPVLDGLYREQIAQWKEQFAERVDRATTDIDRAAQAATSGAVDMMMVDIDEVIPGTVDEFGTVTRSAAPDAVDYGVVDEIASRVLRTGGRVLGVRRADIPEGKSLAALLRHAI